MIILDVETTGLDPKENSIVSIGAIDFNNPEERFYEECRIWEGASVEPEALLVNGMSEEEIRDPDKKSESDILKNFLHWLSDKKNITVAGQNSFFDVSFINAAARRSGEKPPLGARIFEQHSLVMYHMMRRGIELPVKNNRSNIDSDKIMEYVGIPSEPRPHIAINGALWEYEVFYRLLNDKPGLEEFQNYPVPWMK